MSNNKTFRLFISSTFSDFKKEREILHTQVFPVLEKHCQDNGFVFQPIDLRWGVSNEAQLDQKTLELCLEEVRVCKHFPHPNFLIMAGDRYGYIPLPYMIEKKEFEKIRVLVKVTDELELLNFWYKLDENQLPVSYILQPRKDHTQNSNVNDKFKKDFITLNAPVDKEKKEFNAAWSEHENKLRIILQNGANEIFKDKNDKEYQKYFLSATEREVVEGIYDYHNLTSHKVDVKYIFGYFKGQEADIKGDDALKFKANLKSILTPENFVEEIKSLTKKLKDAIYDQITTFEKMTELDKELSEQLNFRNTKAENFIGREITLNKIIAYTQNPKTTTPLIIHGASGMGKSSLMAKAISEANSEDKNIFYRFVGATQNSTVIRDLLISLCNELKEKSIIENIAEYEMEDYQFFIQIKRLLSSIKTPIVIFIDALDQLLYKDYLEWLPQELPNNLKIVLSVLNDKKYEEDTHYFKVLKQRYDNQEFFIDLKEDSLESHKEQLIEKLLKSENRKLDDAQKEYLLKQWKKVNYSPLYLKIAIEEMKHWKSYDTTQTLGDGVEGVIKEYLQNLTSLYHHDKILVDKVLGYIYASKDGLSEKELLEILSEDLEDEKKFQDEIINQFHEPIKKQNPRRDNKEELILPLSLWSRLYSQLKPFIVERNIDKQPLMKFFHRQFASVIDNYAQDYKIKFHSRLADYFLTLQNRSKSWNQKYYNSHVLDELPFQLFQSKQESTLKKILFDLEFIGAVYDENKSKQFIKIIQNIDNLPNVSENELYLYKSFFYEKDKLIQANKSFLGGHEALYQAAYEDGNDSPLTFGAKELLLKNKIDWYWLKPEWEKNASRLGIVEEINLVQEMIYNKKQVGFTLKNGTYIKFFFEKTLGRVIENFNGDILSKEYNKFYTGKYNSQNKLLLANRDVIQWNGFTSYDDYYFLRYYDSKGNLKEILMGAKSHIGEVYELENGNILGWSENGNFILIWDINKVSTLSLRGFEERKFSIEDNMFNLGNVIVTWDRDDVIATWDAENGSLQNLFMNDFPSLVERDKKVDVEEMFIKNSPFVKDNLLITWHKDDSKLCITDQNKKAIVMPNNFGQTKILRVSNYVYFNFLNSFLMKYSIQHGNKNIFLN